jgi:hypothetical protein
MPFKDNEKARAYMKAYREKNKEKYKSYYKKQKDNGYFTTYCKTEKQKEYRKRYYQKNKEKLIAQNTAYKKRIKDEGTYEKALIKIYELIQLESLTEEQGKILANLAFEVESYEAQIKKGGE